MSDDHIPDGSIEPCVCGSYPFLFTGRFDDGNRYGLTCQNPECSQHTAWRFEDRQRAIEDWNLLNKVAT